MQHLLFKEKNTVRLVHYLNSENVSEVEMQLLDYLQNEDELKINLNDLESIDLTGIFMLYSLKQKADYGRKKLELILQNERLKTIIKESKLGHLLL